MVKLYKIENGGFSLFEVGKLWKGDTVGITVLLFVFSCKGR